MDTDNTTPPFGLEPLLDVIELAAYLGVPVSTVYDWRTNGKGPRAFRFGKRLKFAISDVRSWIGSTATPSGVSLLHQPSGRGLFAAQLCHLSPGLTSGRLGIRLERCRHVRE
jgi:excisionase family DNA binding protein